MQILKASELRIGNYINTLNGVEKFTPRMMFGMYNTEVLSKDGFDDRYTPIPLTEEWLLKFGFEKTEIDTHFYYDKHQEDNYSLSICLTDKHTLIGEDWNYFDLKHCEYVHQLQNLYFALTGEELICK